MWVTILALSDRDGYVTATIPGLAAMARMSVDETEKAIGRLMEPDKYSRTTDHEGRRIETADGGWYILNFAKYREIGTMESRKTKTAERQARHRQKRKDLQDSNALVTHSNAKKGKSNAPPIPIHIHIPPEHKEGGCKGETKKVKSYKQWGFDELFENATEKNRDGLLTALQLKEFCHHWIDEIDGSGRPKLHTQKTWSTRGRMQTAKQMIYGKQDQQHPIQKVQVFH